MKQVSVIQALCLSAVSIAFGVVLASATAQQKPIKAAIGSPTSMQQAESDFNRRLDVILGEINKANQELHHQGVQLDRVEEYTRPAPETIEPPPEPRQEVAEVKTIVRLYTADSSWRCPACEQQKRKLKANPPAFDYEIVECPSQGVAPVVEGRRTAVYPTWEVVRPNGSSSARSGQLSTSTLNAWVGGADQASTQSGRYSIAELRNWIRSEYQPGTILMADVQPRSSVWTHLQDHNHGFTAAQVSGLQHWEAMALHDAHHQERITPFRGSAKAVRARRSRVIERPHYAYWSAI